MVKRGLMDIVVWLEYRQVFPGHSKELTLKLLIISRALFLARNIKTLAFLGFRYNRVSGSYCSRRLSDFCNGVMVAKALVGYGLQRWDIS
ncbi:unnamed protein product [Enterobius vermicularis]|uniref:Transposase n=1 Tax=Enterobius vermicularis TaxID=51028 RepID=A0A0N4VMU9_ENTVE|nr:unnamed protein product [Enterobius vermicularis]